MLVGNGREEIVKVRTQLLWVEAFKHSHRLLAVVFSKAILFLPEEAEPDQIGKGHADFLIGTVKVKSAAEGKGRFQRQVAGPEHQGIGIGPGIDERGLYKLPCADFKLS